MKNSKKKYKNPVIQKENGEQLWQVEKVLSKKFFKDENIYKYYIKWQDWDREEDNTWEPVENLSEVLYLVDDFEKEQNEKQIKKNLQKQLELQQQNELKQQTIDKKQKSEVKQNLDKLDIVEKKQKTDKEIIFEKFLKNEKNYEIRRKGQLVAQSGIPNTSSTSNKSGDSISTQISNNEKVQSIQCPINIFTKYLKSQAKNDNLTTIQSDSDENYTLKPIKIKSKKDSLKIEKVKQKSQSPPPFQVEPQDDDFKFKKRKKIILTKEIRKENIQKLQNYIKDVPEFIEEDLYESFSIVPDKYLKKIDQYVQTFQILSRYKYMWEIIQIFIVLKINQFLHICEDLRKRNFCKKRIQYFLKIIENTQQITAIDQQLFKDGSGSVIDQLINVDQGMTKKNQNGSFLDKLRGSQIIGAPKQTEIVEIDQKAIPFYERTSFLERKLSPFEIIQINDLKVQLQKNMLDMVKHKEIQEDQNGHQQYFVFDDEIGINVNIQIDLEEII